MSECWPSWGKAEERGTVTEKDWRPLNVDVQKRIHGQVGKIVVSVGAETEE